MKQWMRALKRLFSKVSQVVPELYLSLGLNTLVSAFLPFVWVVFPAQVVAMAEGAPLSYRPFVLALLGLPGAFLLPFLANPFRMQRGKVRYAFIVDLIHTSLSLPYNQTIRSEHLDAMERASKAVSDPTRGAGGILEVLRTFIGEALALLLLLGLMTKVSPLLLLFFLGLFFLSFILLIQIETIESDAFLGYVDIDRKAHVLIEVGKDIHSFKDIRAYGLSGIIERRFDRFKADIFAIWELCYKRVFKRRALLGVLDLARDLSLFIWLLIKVINGSLPISDFVLFSSAMMTFVDRFQALALQGTKLAVYSKEFMGCCELMDSVEQERHTNKAATSARTRLPEGPLELCFDRVSFTYEGQTEPVLKDFSWTLKAGERWAMVGENGAGKSTLVHLLCRLYKPSSGRITLGGIDIWSMEETEYTALLNVVFQDALVLPFSVLDNVGMQEEIDTPRAKEALKMAHLDGIVEGLPNGIHQTLLRTLDNDGVDLSGGERQKLFLARALYRKHGRLLILDEPTSAMDPLAEAALYQDYAVLAEGKTALFISHRLASTKFCDAIAFLEDGKIIESGSHDALMAAKGRYAALFDIQAKHYKEEA